MREQDQDLQAGHEHAGGLRREDPDRGRQAAEPPASHEIAAAAAGRVDALGAVGMLRMQRYAGNSAAGASVSRAKVHDVVGRPSGDPVPAEVRRLVEQGYGPVPSDARVHTDPQALESAREVGAYAYASGRDIVMPTDAPRRVQLEETVHLVQQSRGAVAGTDTGTGVSVSSPTDAYEVEAQNVAATLDAGAAVQRNTGDEELEEEPTEG